MSRYFTTISYLTNPKNKLQDEVQQFFRRHSDRVFSDVGEKQGFVKYMHHSLKEMHERHPRCNKIDLTNARAGHSSSRKKATIYFFPGGNFSITEENLSYGK